MGALLGFHVGIWDYPTSYTAHAYVAHATVVQQVQKNMDLCGWMGVQVSPMTAEPLLDPSSARAISIGGTKNSLWWRARLKRSPDEWGLVL
jgi:hypothetical protein